MASSNSDTKGRDLSFGKVDDLIACMAIRDASVRLKSYPNLAMTLLGELFIYGRTNNQEMVQGLRRIHEATVLHHPVEHREEIYEILLDRAEKGGASPNVLLPFIGSEPWGPLASRATIDFCMVVAITTGVPDAGIHAVGSIMGSDHAVNRGAIFGGLLCLGDRRAHSALLKVRDQLEPNEVDQAVRIHTGFVSAATIEFYVDWMEERLQVSDERIFGALAAGMHNQISAARVPAVLTGQRAIPPGALPEDVEERMEAWVPLASYAAQIAARLRALEAAETHPKLMPEILEAWGLAADE
jgi:hypothetical protein